MSVWLYFPQSIQGSMQWMLVIWAGILTIAVSVGYNREMGALMPYILVIWVFRLMQSNAESKPGNRTGWVFVSLMVIFTILIVVRNTLATPQFQGRFLFPALGPFALLTIVGWSSLFRGHKHLYWVYFIPLLMVVLNLALWFTQVIPIYFQPFLD